MVRIRCALVAALALCLALLTSGCATREVYDSSYDRQGIEVLLRSHHKGSSPMERSRITIKIAAAAAVPIAIHGPTPFCRL